MSAATAVAIRYHCYGVEKLYGIVTVRIRNLTLFVSKASPAPGVYITVICGSLMEGTADGKGY
jgi:hypothetical protein